MKGVTDVKPVTFTGLEMRVPVVVRPILENPYVPLERRILIVFSGGFRMLTLHAMYTRTLCEGSSATTSVKVLWVSYASDKVQRGTYQHVGLGRAGTGSRVGLRRC